MFESKYSQKFELPEDIKKKIKKTPCYVAETTLLFANVPIKDIENLFRNTAGYEAVSQPYQAIRRSNYV